MVLLDECCELGVEVGASTFDGLLVETTSIDAAGFRSVQQLEAHLCAILQSRLGFQKGVVVLTCKPIDVVDDFTSMLTGDRKPEQLFSPAPRRVDLVIPFGLHQLAKAVGAQFDWDVKRWFIPRGGNLLAFRHLSDSGSLALPPGRANSKGHRHSSLWGGARQGRHQGIRGNVEREPSTVDYSSWDRSCPFPEAGDVQAGFFRHVGCSSFCPCARSVG